MNTPAGSSVCIFSSSPGRPSPLLGVAPPDGVDLVCHRHEFHQLLVTEKQHVFHVDGDEWSGIKNWRERLRE